MYSFFFFQLTYRLDVWVGLVAGPSSARPARPRPLAEVLAELNFIFSASSASPRPARPARPTQPARPARPARPKYSVNYVSSTPTPYTYTLHHYPLPTTHYPLLTSAYHSIAEGQVMMTEDGLRRQWILLPW